MLKEVESKVGLIMANFFPGASFPHDGEVLPHSELVPVPRGHAQQLERDSSVPAAASREEQDPGDDVIR